ncbi:MAG TPA: AgmX/PglI C-terminal domain-containing protein [Polyangiaceae bacterium]|jgi:hypothetical protein
MNVRFALSAAASIAFACAGSEPPPQVRTNPPERAATDAGAGDAELNDAQTIDAATAERPPVDAHRLLRAELVRTYVGVGLRGFGRSPCARPVGSTSPCVAKDEARMIRKKLPLIAKRIEEAQAFLAAHPDAPAVEASCLTSLAAAGEKLAKSLERGGPSNANRMALQKQLDACDASLEPAIAAVGDPVPKHEPDASWFGSLPPAEIQRVVRGHFGRFKLCYQDGLRRDPSLAGRVSTNYIIDTDGSVLGARADDSTLPDAAVIECVVRAFDSIRFPPPQGGYVTVVYPVIFSPGDQ